MSDLKAYFAKLKEQGLSLKRESLLLRELRDERCHDHADSVSRIDEHGLSSLYNSYDFTALEAPPTPEGTYTMRIHSIDELLERDKMREKDGFPRKIRVGKLVKPARGGKDKFVVVPTTVEEKFIHDRVPTGEGEPTGGTGEGEEGEVIGERPVRPEQGPGQGGAGGGEGESHEMESSAYDLGKILTEKFELPNLKDKGKKSSLTRYTYDLTDKNRGFGQLLDKKATLRKILETNINLGNVPDITDIDTTRFLISPKDKVYRILSREIDYESQALVFFLRDYSGSMEGKATELVASQHVMIYSWLLYQFARQVESRFILHDNEAKEVPDFHTYYNLQVAGGTKVASAYRLVNDIVERESLAKEYNIYVFHGTDGDDWDSDGVEAIPELKKMLTYSNRIGITIAEHGYSESRNTEVERYLNKSELLKEMPGLLRLDVMDEDAEESRLIEGIKKLIS